MYNGQPVWAFILGSLNPLVQKHIIPSYEYQLKNLIFKNVSVPFKILTRVVKKELKILIRKQLLEQIQENLIHQLPKENPIAIKSKFLNLNQQKCANIPKLCCHLALIITVNFKDYIKKYDGQFDIILKDVSFMSVFLKCVKNVLKKINSEIDIDSDKSTSYLVSNSFDYSNSDYYMQITLKFIDILDDFHDTDNFFIIKNIKSIMSQFLIPLICPMNVDSYILFRDIMKTNCTESNISDITNQFLSLIFDDDFTVNFEFHYQEDLFLFCIEYAENYLRKLNKFDHPTDNNVKTEKELILYGFSLYYLFVFLAGSEDETKQIQPDKAVRILEMAEEIGYDWDFDSLIESDTQKKLDDLGGFVSEEITGLCKHSFICV